MISHDRPSSVSRRKRPSCAPNSAPKLTCGLNDDRKVRKATTPLVMVRVAAPAEAIFSATMKGFPPEGRANTASTRGPSIAAPERLTNSFAAGSPHRTSAPGSLVSLGAAPPPIASPTTTAMSAATTRIVGPTIRRTTGFMEWYLPSQCQERPGLPSQVPCIHRSWGAAGSPRREIQEPRPPTGWSCLRTPGQPAPGRRL